jgi:hypothetical protein
MNNPTTVEQYNALSIVKLLRLRNALPKSSSHSERPSFVRDPARTPFAQREFFRF